MTTSLKRPHGPSRVVALAGGTGRLGQHVAEGIAQRGNVTLVLLLRKDNESLVSRLQSLLPVGSTVKVVAAVVKFDSKPESVAGLISVFETNIVDTIISCLFTPDAEAVKEADNALFQAALAVESVRRFGPDDWAVGIDILNLPRMHHSKRHILGLLANSPLHYTCFSCGIFMNFLAHNSPASARAEADPSWQHPLGHLSSFAFIFDIASGKGSMPRPDDGPAPRVSFIRVEDIGRMVAASLDLDRWAYDTGSMTADTISLDLIPKWAEEITGKPIDVADFPLTQIMSSISDDPATPIMQNFFLEILALVARGQCAVPNKLGESLAEAGIEITGGRLKGVRESLEEWWAVEKDW